VTVALFHVRNMTRCGCVSANCTAGEHIDATEAKCKPCERGTYQSKEWQLECDKCPLNKTTLGLGYTDRTDCVTNCSSGMEYNTTTGSCESCPRGVYRTQNVNDLCVPCPRGRTTRTLGASTSGQCEIADCRAGQHFADIRQVSCNDCERGYYQDKSWQDSCIKCPQSMTTVSVGSTSVTECKLKACMMYRLGTVSNVPSVYQYSAGSSRSSFLCDENANMKLSSPLSQAKKRYYPSERKGIDLAWGYCPGANVLGWGNVRGDKKWQTECISCGPRKTTATEGATAEDQCLSTDSCSIGRHDCTLPENGGTCILVNHGPDYTCGCRKGWYLDSGTACTRECDSGWQIDENTGQCTLCPRGFYKDKQQHIYCQPCPRHLVTSGPGSTAESDCSQGM
ncbi:hypothetical protein LSAT2_026715, partial [Lamellibrachia satsuma]